jgi:hypothetical protein
VCRILITDCKPRQSPCRQSDAASNFSSQIHSSQFPSRLPNCQTALSKVVLQSEEDGPKMIIASVKEQRYEACRETHRDRDIRLVHLVGGGVVEVFGDDVVVVHRRGGSVVAEESSENSRYENHPERNSHLKLIETVQKRKTKTNWSQPANNFRRILFPPLWVYLVDARILQANPPRFLQLHICLSKSVGGNYSELLIFVEHLYMLSPLSSPT